MGKSLQELTIKDNFMFAAVMMEEENCKELLEMVLKIKIAKITVYMEKTIVYNPEYKGVRLDIEAEDEFHTHYDVEMQKIKNEENQELLNEFLKKLVEMNHKEEVTDFIERNYGK